MEKVILTTVEREALHNLEVFYDGNQLKICQMISSGTFIASKDAKIKLLTACLNGYDVEKSPNEVIKDYYDYLKNDLFNTSIDSEKWNVLRNSMDSVKFVLDTLNIEIEGINNNLTN